MTLRDTFVSLAALAALSGCASAPWSDPEPESQPTAAAEAPDAALIADGRRIARIECGACHATGERGVSPNPNAPPLRTVLADYNPRALEIDLAEGIRIGHQNMPKFELSPLAVQSLTAYLVSIQDS